jgi:N6-adenosine-specific RNA methylase IME4
MDRTGERVQYRTIVADPPWPYNDPFGGFNAAGRGPNVRRPLPYPSLQVSEIAALPVCGLAEEDGANLFFWTTNRFLPDSFAIVRAWGFDYRQLLVWHKTGSSPISGSIAPTSCEFVLFARLGRSVDVGRFPDALLTTKRIANAHSRKPDAFLDLIEQVSPGPYLELFARRQRLGWDTWGNESLEHVAVGA